MSKNALILSQIKKIAERRGLCPTTLLPSVDGNFAPLPPDSRSPSINRNCLRPFFQWTFVVLQALSNFEPLLKNTSSPLVWSSNLGPLGPSTFQMVPPHMVIITVFHEKNSSKKIMHQTIFLHRILELIKGLDFFLISIPDCHLRNYSNL